MQLQPKKPYIKKEKKLQLKLEKEYLREKALEDKKEDGVGIRGIIKFDIAKNNVTNTLNNNLFEKMSLIMRVKNTFYFSMQRADIKLKIKMLRHNGELRGFRLYKLIQHYITIVGKYSIFKIEEINSLNEMLDKF